MILKMEIYDRLLRWKSESNGEFAFSGDFFELFF